MLACQKYGGWSWFAVGRVHRKISEKHPLEDIVNLLRVPQGLRARLHGKVEMTLGVWICLPYSEIIPSRKQHGLLSIFSDMACRIAAGS